MTPQPGATPIPGSERQPLSAEFPAAQRSGSFGPQDTVDITVLLRSRAAGGVPSPRELGGQPPSERRYLSREEYANQFGAAPDDIARLETFARQQGLAVIEADAGRRSVRLSGTAEAMGRAFGVDLQRYEYAGQVYRSHSGPVYVSGDLLGVVEGVFGLDTRPQASPRSREISIEARATAVSYTPIQVAHLYDYPTGVSGQGECIALIELGGGYRQADIDTYFSQLGVSAPQVVAVSVDGGQNQPTTPSSADGEVMLDIEVAGGVAPGARLAVYFAPNTDQGFLDAITTAAHDATNHPSVISISWGAPEANWTAQAMQAMDQAFQAAALLGVTVCIASGDGGSSDGLPQGLHVDFPASSPHALGCGGTHLEGTAGTISSETVWNDGAQGGAGGGGVSAVFALPDWQGSANVPPPATAGQGGRGVPDVAGDADPATGYQVTVDGNSTVYGGTSAVAPLWSGLIALINQATGHPAGYLNPLLYAATATTAFHDIVQGNNDSTAANGGQYQAAPGWDACTGLGSPDGQQLLTTLAGPASGASAQEASGSPERRHGRQEPGAGAVGPMQYRFLGRTGVRVSELCLGTMTFGVSADEPTAQRIVDRFLGAGGNFIDTANTYGRPNTGLSETILGKTLLGKRDQVVLATKVRFVMGDGPNDAGLSRRHIMEQAHASLRRLQTDRIDLYQIHCWDNVVPIADVLRTLDDLVAAGKVLHIGCSNLTGWQLGKALATSEWRGWARFECFQAEYSLAARGAEREIIPACLHEGLGVIAWSPLAGGFLSGKYHREAQAPTGSRLAGRPEFPERHWRILAAVEQVARARNRSVPQVALAWLLARPGLTAPILGVRTPEQLADDLGAIGWQLSAEDLAALDAASAIEPGYPYDFQAGAVNRR